MIYRGPAYIIALSSFSAEDYSRDQKGTEIANHRLSIQHQICMHLLDTISMLKVQALLKACKEQISPDFTL